MKHLLPMDNRDFVRITGAVYTPYEVAIALTQISMQSLGQKKISVLEPSVGDGCFISSINEIRGKGVVYEAVDINAKAFEQIETRLPSSLLHQCTFNNRSFLAYALENTDKKFDLIIGNPPFIRKNNFSESFKAEIKSTAAALNYPEKDLKNSWAAFLLLAEKLLAENGVLSFILPYEILTVDYGQRALKELSQKFSRIDIYVPDEKAFKEIDQDAVAIIAKKKSKIKGVSINRVKSLSHLSVLSSHTIRFNNETNFSLELKSFLFNEETIDLLQTLRRKANIIRDYCDSAPGVVSAANDFFILTKQQVREMEVADWSVPILKKGSFIGLTPVFTDQDFGALTEKEPCYLLKIRKSDEQNFPLSLIEHIKAGEAAGLNQRYKCRHRQTWYEVPIVEPAAGFFFKRAHSFPRLCVNSAKVHVTDTAYGLKPAKGFSIRGLCFSFYNSLTLLFSEIDGRFYGGGVLELSPFEFKSLPLAYSEPSIKDFKDFVRVHVESNGNIEKILDFADGRLADYYNLSDHDLSLIRDAWRIVRAHRLRHSGRSNHFS